MDRINAVSFDSIATGLSDSRLHLIIMPTEKCNFRCTYCYEDFELGKMSQAVHAGLIKLLDKRLNDLTNLEIGWFGGEPLLNLPAIRKTSQFVVAHERVKSGECNYRSSISTNAYLLTEDVSSELISLGVKSFQITLDGLETHDQTRKSANGKATFPVIWSNLKLMKGLSANFSTGIRVHVHKSNFSDVSNLIDLIVEEFGDDARFHVFIKAVEKLSSNCLTDNILNGQEKDDVVSALRAKLEGTTLSTPDRRYSLPCYASNANSFVIRSNGQIAKCTVDFKSSANNVGELTPDGKLVIDNDALRPWIRGLIEGDVHAATCPLGSVKNAQQKRLIPIYSV